MSPCLPAGVDALPRLHPDDGAAENIPAGGPAYSCSESERVRRCSGVEYGTNEKPGKNGRGDPNKDATGSPADHTKKKANCK